MSHRAAFTPKSRRSQSEVVGVILLTAVIVLLAAVVGGFVLSSIDTEREPTLDVDVTVNSSAVELAHDGGDTVGAADVVVILDGDTRIGLDAFTELQGDGDARFEAGEIRNHSHTASDTLRIDVVHEPTNTLIHSDVYDVP